MALNEFLIKVVGAASGAIKAAKDGVNNTLDDRATERAIRQEAARVKAAKEQAERERIAREKAEQERLAARKRKAVIAGIGALCIALAAFGIADKNKKEAEVQQQKAERDRQTEERQAAAVEKRKADEAKRKAESEQRAKERAANPRPTPPRSSRDNGSCWRYINGGPVNVCD